MAGSERKSAADAALLARVIVPALKNPANVRVPLRTVPHDFKPQTYRDGGAIRPKVRYGTVDFRPRIYFEDGVLKGTALERHRKLFTEAGLQFSEHFFQSFSRMINEVKVGEGSIDLWHAMESNTMTELGLLVRPTIFDPLRVHIIGLEKQKPPKLEDLKVRALITILGYSYGGLVDGLKKQRPAMQLLVVNDHKSALRLLKAKRAPYFIGFLAPSSHFASKMGMNELSSTEVYAKPLFLFVSRNHPDAEVLAEKLSEASARILAHEAATGGLERRDR